MAPCPHRAAASFPAWDRADSGPSDERFECRNPCPALPGGQMSHALELDHGFRLVRGGIEPSCLGDWNVFVGCPVQDHYWHADAADQRLRIELIGEQQPVRQGWSRSSNSRRTDA